MCTTCLWPLHFGWLLVLSLYKEDYLQILNVCPFYFNFFCSSWEGFVPVNRFNHTSWMTVVTITDRLKSVHNRCVIEVFGGVFVLSIGFRIFCWYRSFCHRTESDLLFLKKWDQMTGKSRRLLLDKSLYYKDIQWYMTCRGASDFDMWLSTCLLRF